MSTRIHIPGDVGPTITVALPSEPPKRYRVVDGVVSVPDNGPRLGDFSAAETVLAIFEGAEVVT